MSVLPATGDWYSIPSNSGQSYPHAPTDYAGCNTENTGPITQTTPKKFADITDGTSMCILLGEKRMDRRNLGNYQGDDNEGYTSGWDHDVMRSSTIQPRTDSNNGSGWGENRFGATHVDMFHVLWCDGSVKALSYNIDLATFTGLCNREDGKVYQAP